MYVLITVSSSLHNIYIYIFIIMYIPFLGTWAPGVGDLTFLPSNGRPSEEPPGNISRIFSWFGLQGAGHSEYSSYNWDSN